jgi:positive regulator of sigma E activity
LAAVELRKRVTALWIQLPVEERDQIKAKLPEVILLEQGCVFFFVFLPLFLNYCLFSNLVRHSIARVIAMIASIEVPQNTWPALLPFLQQSCTSQQVVHREVGSYILFTVLESIVEGFESHLHGLFELFRGLIVDPESSEVRITTVKWANFLICN